MAQTLTVNYGEGFLQITIPTNQPAIMHQQLMRGIAIAARHYMDSEDRKPEEAVDLAALMLFLQHLIPDEERLRTAYQPKMTG